MDMKQYKVTIEGLSPLLMHSDNLAMAEKLAAWRKDPANKAQSTKGDDRSPAWTWLSYAYHDGRNFNLPSDNLMTCLREAGAKVSTGKGTETFKKHTQSGLMVDGQGFALYARGATVPIEPFKSLDGEQDFLKHTELVESYNFELMVKRAKVGQSKHIRVRPMFRSWSAEGTITVLDETISGLTEPVLQTILKQAGSLIGVGDWRPSSPKSPGPFGTFSATIEAA